MFGSIKIAAIGSLVALIVGFGAGVKVRGWQCDAAAGKAQAAHDARQLNARDAADASESVLVPEQEKDASNLESKANDLRGKISDGECFTAGDVDRLRDLWPSAPKR